VTIEASRAGATQRLTATLAKPEDHELSLGDDNFRFNMPDSFRFNVPVPPVPPAPPVPPMDHLFENGDRGQRFFFRDRDRLVEGGRAASASRTRRSRASSRATSRSTTARCW
jgi:hypothetical protein